MILEIKQEKMSNNIQKIVQDISLLNEWEYKYQYIINLGNSVNIEEKERVEKNLVNNCMSKVWLIPYRKNKYFYFKGDSDSLIMKGILAILFTIFSGKSQQEIKSINLGRILKSLNLFYYLSQGRKIGILSIVKSIKQYCEIK